MSKRNYRVVILGAGRIGGVHLRAAVHAEDVTPVAIADTIPEAAERQAACFTVRVYTDYREMIDRERPDIAVIALPPFLHLEAAEYCAERGCHILMEKPMARSAQECESINRAVERHGVRMLVGHTMHFSNLNVLAKRLLDSGELGKLLMINHNWHAFYYNDRLDWFFDRKLSGGGILMNLGSHSLDLVQWMSSSRVSRVNARLHYAGRRGDIEAAGTVMVETESGVPAVLTLYGYHRRPKNELELMCENGVIRVVLNEGAWVIRDSECISLGEPDEQDSYSEQLEMLARAIGSGGELECGGAYGKSIIEAVEAIYRSHESGQIVELKGAYAIETK
ncbi:Gfo/Idh/MocA family protein [Paenibacillus koleovorans]|uniref:Gfo/Idh/MocA family protein n=1 Tax=Paenibacillus koleovorans TaxID=121608 RepID=UPI000FD91584|nr:Gfo/Idh/MocA family oxidoreductase [Paenibacillus koleovorans]